MPTKLSRKSNIVPIHRASRSRPDKQGPRVTMGTLVGLEEDGTILVQIKGGARAAHAARTTIPLESSNVGREVTLLLENSESMPVITGLILAKSEQRVNGTRTVKLDGERLLLTAEREIVLRCGEASITLTHDGKVVVKGANLVQSATGLNRIKGASVQIN